LHECRCHESPTDEKKGPRKSIEKENRSGLEEGDRWLEPKDGGFLKADGATGSLGKLKEQASLPRRNVKSETVSPGIMGN
jgi:hypothetical protein